MLLEKRTVSGTLSFPEGYYAPPGGIISPMRPTEE